MSKKKVLFLGRFSPPVHGASVMNENYFNSLDEDKNFDIQKIKINYSDSLDELGKINLKKFLGFFIVLFQTLFNLIKFRPNIVYFEIAPKGFAFYRDSIYALLCKMFRRNIIFQFHAKGISDSVKNRMTREYYKLIFGNSRIILLSKILYEDVKEVINKNQIEFLPNGIKDELTDKEFKEIIQKRKKNKKLVLLFLSNMIETKGPLDILKICNELKKQKIEFEFNFVGKFQNEDFEKRFFNEIKNLDLEKNCKYLGPKYGKEKQQILEKTNYLIFPTRYREECFPLVILEAFMYGISVFSYDNASIKEIISENYLGFVAKQGDWEILAKNLILRLNKKENHKKIREYFKKDYTLKNSAKKLKNILQI